MTYTLRAGRWDDKIRKAYPKDSLTRDTWTKGEPGPRVTKCPQTRMWLWDGLVYVPTTLREELIQGHHEDQEGGHFGVERTAEKITWNYYFPGLYKTVQKVISKCDICKRTKHEGHTPYGHLQSITPPQRAWEGIAFDMIVKLPPSKEPVSQAEYDSIWVITDRLTKYAYFIPYKESSTATKLAYAFLRTVVANHGVPRTIITDRGVMFTLKFWQTFTALLGTKHKLSTAYHSQIDGQTERLNRTLEQYLRAYLNYQQDNWVSLLPMVQFAYNSSKHSATGISPFFANYGYKPELFQQALPGKEHAQKPQLMVESMKALQEHLAKDLVFISE